MSLLLLGITDRSICIFKHRSTYVEILRRKIPFLKTQELLLKNNRHIVVLSTGFSFLPFSDKFTQC